MKRFFRIFIILLLIFSAIKFAIFGIGYFFKGNATENNTNVENIVKNESSSQEDIEGTVVSKRSTENN